MAFPAALHQGSQLSEKEGQIYLGVFHDSKERSECPRGVVADSWQALTVRGKPGIAVDFSGSRSDIASKPDQLAAKKYIFVTRA